MNKPLPPAQEHFVSEYLTHWNGTKAYMAAYPKVRSENTAAACASKLLRNAKVKARIEEIQSNVSEEARTSALRNQKELAKIAYSSLTDFYEDWFTLKDFNQLTDEQKACIAEVSTIERTDPKGNPIKIVKLKLHDKLSAIKTLNQMNGWNAPEKVDHTTGGEQLKITPIMFFATGRKSN